MAPWTTFELQTSHIGDVRLDQRYASILEGLAESPQLSIPAALDGWAEVQGAYRFFANKKVTLDKVLAPHIDATTARIAETEVVLVIQDTTEIDITKPNECMAGAGPLDGSSSNRRGFHLHVNAAFRPDGLYLGLIAALIWAREPADDSKSAKQRAQERRNKPPEEKESHRWIEGFLSAADLARPEGTQVVSIADSEGDIYELFQEAAGAAAKASHPTDFIVRACHDRVLGPIEGALLPPGGADLGPNEAGPAPTAPTLYGRASSAEVLTEFDLEVQGRPAKVKVDGDRDKARTPRTAHMEVRAFEVMVPPPKTKQIECGPEPTPLNVVFVREASPPNGEAPVEWMLLTTLPIGTKAEALKVVEYYKKRWMIELLFKTLKSGCNVEKSQLESHERFWPLVGVLLVVAWRVMSVTWLARVKPEAPATQAFSEMECQAAFGASGTAYPKGRDPTMKEMLEQVARLGGWLGRKHDGPPGTKAVWTGMQRLSNIVTGMIISMKQKREN